MGKIIRINENFIRKIVTDTVNNVINEGLITSHSFYSLIGYLKPLGFQRLMTSLDYDGKSRSTIKHLKIPDELYTDDTSEKFNNLLNVFGWRIIKSGSGCDSYDNVCKFFDIEAKYGKDCREGNDIFYHAAPKNKVGKILRNGLCPRDGGKRGEYRGPRVYLTTVNDDFLFNSVLGYNTDYEVFEVDLRNSGIKIYTDEYADNAVYTLDNIPPSRIRLTRNKAKEKDEKRKEFWSEISKLAEKYDLEIKGNKLFGDICGTVIEFQFETFPYVSHRGCNFEFTITKRKGYRYYMSDVIGFNDIGKVVSYVEKEIAKIIKRDAKKRM